MAFPVLVALAIFIAGCVGTEGFVRGKHFDRVIVVPFENILLNDALDNSFLKSFSQQSNARLYGNYFAPIHSSQPNYYTMVSGDYFGITDDENHVINGSCYGGYCTYQFTNSIVDTLDDKDISWKIYAEQYPGSLTVSEMLAENATVTNHGCGSPTDEPALQHSYSCYSSGGCYWAAFSNSSQIYARKHVPFLSFDTFFQSEARCQKVVDETEFWNDWEADILPQYIYYAPNQCNDGHGCAACPYPSFAAKTSATASWLENFITRLESKASYKAQRNLYLFVYDENDYLSHKNQVYTVAYGPGVVKSASTYHCPRSGCFFTKSQERILKQDCFGRGDLEGAGDDLQCGNADNTTTLAGTISPKDFYSAYSAANGLKADMTFYNHYSIVPMISNNWDLAPLWQGGSSSRALRLK